MLKNSFKIGFDVSPTVTGFPSRFYLCMWTVERLVGVQCQVKPLIRVDGVKKNVYIVCQKWKFVCDLEGWSEEVADLC